VLSSIPRKRPDPIRYTGPVCYLRRDVTGSAAPPFGFLSHGAAKFTLSHSARRFAPLARGPTASAGLLTLRLDAAISGDARSLLRGAPALTAAGLAPASLMQHRNRAVQTRIRSRRTTPISIGSGAAPVHPGAPAPSGRGPAGSRWRPATLEEQKDSPSEVRCRRTKGMPRTRPAQAMEPRC